MLPALARQQCLVASRCSPGRHATYVDGHVRVSSYNWEAITSWERASLGAMLANPHDEDEDLGTSFGMTVERSCMGNTRLRQLGLEENQCCASSVVWM